MLMLMLRIQKGDLMQHAAQFAATDLVLLKELYSRSDIFPASWVASSAMYVSNRWMNLTHKLSIK